MKVEDIVRVKGAGVFTLPADESIAVAAKRMMEQRIGAVVVCDGDGRPRGVLSERDIVHGLASHGREVLGMPIRALMRAEIIALQPIGFAVEADGLDDRSADAARARDRWRWALVRDRQHRRRGQGQDGGD